jgi:hypothetical protein
MVAVIEPLPLSRAEEAYAWKSIADDGTKPFPEVEDMG